MTKKNEATVEVVTEFNATDYITTKGSKSSAIRALLAEGKTRSQVAKLLNIRYQHVRNVEVTPLKKAETTTTTTTTE